MAETYIQMFQEEFYPPLFRTMADDTIEAFTKEKEQIIGTWKKSLKQYMEQLTIKQQQQQAEPVVEMNLSFLYTSLETGNAQFRIDSYGWNGRVASDSMETGYLPAHWLTTGMERFEEELRRCAREHSLQRYIRGGEIETLKLRAVKSLLYYFALRFKYIIPEMIDFKVLAKVQKGETFLLQIGEYMDWQKTIYAILPVIDIFNCDKSTDLRFRKFPAYYYQNKVFQSLIMNQSMFQDCTFEDVVIDNCVMNDCFFDGCLFERVTIRNTHMLGSQFINCTFRKVTFEHTVFLQEEPNEAEPDYYEPAEFYGSVFEESVFSKCNLDRCFVTACDKEGVTVTQCSTSRSGFEQCGEQQGGQEA